MKKDRQTPLKYAYAPAGFNSKKLRKITGETGAPALKGGAIEYNYFLSIAPPFRAGDKASRPFEPGWN